MAEPSDPRATDAFEETLGEGARELLSELDAEGRAHARRALEALAEALGEDERDLAQDPGLPGDYEVLDVLGRGSGGIVYRARQRSLAREVAVKVLHDRHGAREVERLLGEGRRLAALRHPGIVVVHEIGRARNGIYVTLGCEPGGSLQDLLAQGPLNAARVARLVRQTAEALAYTHARGVVHLDLKPSNVLLDAEGNAKVADFGLARELTAAEPSMALSTSGGLIGTPAFMAPEQAADRREEIGERTDVYGLGALIYTGLVGRPPFVERSLAATLDAVRQAEPRSIASAVPDAPRDLVAIAAVAMAKDPRERYATARAMAADLARFEAGEPVTARPPGALRRMARRVRRHRRDLFVALLAAGLALVSLLPFREDAREDLARVERATLLRAAEELESQGESTAAALLLARAAGAGAGSGAVDPAPESAQETAAPAPPEVGPPVAVAVACFLVLDDGRSERLWADSARSAVGAGLRLEGRGRASLSGLPGGNSGVDYLHVAPPMRGGTRRDLSAEIGGPVVELQGELAWAVDDREFELRVQPIDGSFFVHLASEAVLADGAQLLEARRYLWGGQGATVVVLGELAPAAELDPGAVERDLDGWRRAIRAALARATRTRHAPLDWQQDATAAQRAAMIDRVIALALLGDREVAAPLENFEAGCDFAALGDEAFAARGTFAKVTTAGRDLDGWLAQARAAATRAHLEPAAALEGLPEPSSARHRAHALPGLKEWIWLAYELAALALVVVGLTAAPGSPRRRTAFGWALMPAALSLDKVTLPTLGSFAFDPLACALLAAALLGLAPWAGRRARLASVAFALAALQALAVAQLGWPDVRVPAALGLAALAGVVAALEGHGRLAWLVPLAWFGFLPLAGLALLLPDVWILRASAYWLTLVWTMCVSLLASYHAGRRAPAGDAHASPREAQETAGASGSDRPAR